MAGPNDVDILILGGGLAGLSLAARLARLPKIRTLIVEPRTAYPRDRTWCYWRLHDHPFGDAVARSWTTWEVLRDGAAPTLQTSAIPYEMIPADRLYRSGQAIIEAAPHIELWGGCEALAVAEGPDRVVVETSRGPVSAGLVLDSRPPPADRRGLAQRFLGQEVVTARPVFDPDRVTLMDFAVEQLPGAVHFLYVLPTSPTTALVEDTWLAPGDAVLPDYRASIAAYLGSRFGVADYAVEFEEEGAIPMDPGLQAPASGGRVIPVGTAGGAVKPSSGYAFFTIQRMADSLAGTIGEGRRPPPFQPRSAVARRLDEILLRLLREAPEEAPGIFHTLFRRCAPEPLIRFLNDVGTPADTARVIAAMPKLPMIGAATGLLGTRPRRSARR